MTTLILGVLAFSTVRTVARAGKFIADEEKGHAAFALFVLTPLHFIAFATAARMLP